MSSERADPSTDEPAEGPAAKRCGQWATILELAAE